MCVCFRRPCKGRRLAPELFGTGTHMCLGTATFIRSSRLTLLGSERVLLRSKLPMLIERATSANVTDTPSHEVQAIGSQIPLEITQPVPTRGPPPKGKGGKGKGTKRQRQLQKKMSASVGVGNSRRARRRLRGVARGRPISALLSMGLGKDVKTKGKTSKPNG